jgi:hypothetical protein
MVAGREERDHAAHGAEVTTLTWRFDIIAAPLCLAVSLRASEGVWDLGSR